MIIDKDGKPMSDSEAREAGMQVPDRLTPELRAAMAAFTLRRMKLFAALTEQLPTEENENQGGNDD